MTISFSVRSAILATLAACGSVGAPQLPDGGSQAPPDSASQLPPDSAPAGARCDPTRPFGAPAPVAGVNTTDDEFSFALTRDELTGFVSRVVQDTAPSALILATKRATLADPFGTPTADATSLLNGVDGDEIYPFPSSDGLTLYFSRAVSGGDPQLITATRASIGATFQSELQLQVEGAAVAARSSVITADGGTLYWVDPTSTLHSASRDTGPSEFITQLDLSLDEVASAVLSADELTVYYSNSAVSDILVATRASKTAGFDVGTALPGLDSIAGDAPVFLTSDGCVLYFKSNRPGGRGGDDLWQAARPRHNG